MKPDKMDKSDQKYLLNSEILVIVQHMMMKRRKELERKENESTAHKLQDRDCKDSFDSVSNSSGAESPDLTGSDLCDSDVDTDDLVCSNTDTDTDSPKHRQHVSNKPPTKKRGSFFRFMISRAQQWKKRKSEKRENNSTAISKGSNARAQISTISGVTTAKDIQQKEIDHGGWPGTSTEVNTMQMDSTDNILDPKHFTTELSNNYQSTSDSTTENRSTEQWHESEQSKMEKNFNKREDNPKFLKPPGLTIPKMGYFGLSEGNIPQAVSRALSEESVNRILSEESLLGDYIKDMSHLCSPNRVSLQIPDTAVRQLVSSMENLSITCKSTESLSEAIHKSLLDLRSMTEEVDEDLESLIKAHGHDDKERRISLFIQEEDEVPLCMGENDPIASVEETPEFCRRSSDGLSSTSNKWALIESMTQHMWRVSETF